MSDETNENAPLTPESAAAMLRALADAITPPARPESPKEPPKHTHTVANVNFTTDEFKHLKQAITIAAALNDDGMLVLDEGEDVDPGEEFFWCVKIIAHSLARIWQSQTVIEY